MDYSGVVPAFSSSRFQSGYHAKHKHDHKQQHRSQYQSRREIDEDENEDHGDPDMTTVLFQWEEPVDYLFSHPYSRETVTLHRLGGYATNNDGVELEETESDDDDDDNDDDDDDDDDDEYRFKHDQLMEKYYIHDCVIHPGWRGKGLASKLWKALEESLIPVRDRDHGRNLDTDRRDLDEDMNKVKDEQEPRNLQEHTDHQHRRHSRRRREGLRGSKMSRHRKGALNLREIVLVSVRGTRPFWELVGGFRVVNDHDIDLSVYGDAAFLMSRPFMFY
ncbi:hypothetical protein BGZ65_006421 [Modicella reniformis]|uniref:N-acetyltransferase domain-containing protein n=1 Tax=Modicella reniformis TaxID=1440133 RepID=A0A9P6MGD2_9FUNG|nr:hypothetical protein BGZ65_006421 [Modicella reniformis]